MLRCSKCDLLTAKAWLTVIYTFSPLIRVTIVVGLHRSVWRSNNTNNHDRRSLIVIRVPIRPWVASGRVIHDGSNRFLDSEIQKLSKRLDARKKIKLLVSAEQIDTFTKRARHALESRPTPFFFRCIQVAHEKSRWILTPRRASETREVGEREDGRPRMFSGKIAPGDCRCRRWNKKSSPCAFREERPWKAKTREKRREKRSARCTYFTRACTAPINFRWSPLTFHGLYPKTKLSTVDERVSDARDMPPFSAWWRKIAAMYTAWKVAISGRD